MPVLDDAKRPTRRPAKGDLPGLICERKSDRFAFADDGQTPNNRLPLILYKAAMLQDRSSTGPVVSDLAPVPSGEQEIGIGPGIVSHPVRRQSGEAGGDVGADGRRLTIILVRAVG
jgi:hypothetical protein